MINHDVHNEHISTITNLKKEHDLIAPIDEEPETSEKANSYPKGPGLCVTSDHLYEEDGRTNIEDRETTLHDHVDASCSNQKQVSKQSFL